MERAYDRDVVIAGGGMVGAALAALLAATNRHWRIALVERFALPDADPETYRPGADERSTAIAHGSVSLLREAGVWPALLPFATPIQQVHVSDRGHLGGALIEAGQLGVEALGYVVPNACIGRGLLAHLRTLPNVALMAPAEVTRATPVAGGMLLDLAGSGADTDLYTQLLVVADGANSALCRRLGIDTRVEDYRQTAIIANITCEQPHGGVAFERFTDEGPLAMLPLGGADGRECALVWTQPGDAAALRELEDAPFLERLQQRFGHRLGRLLAVGRRDAWPLTLCLASEQVRSSLVVMGNAAHFLHPVAGQGFNLALRDCAALSACLGGAGERPLGSIGLLQDYRASQDLDQRTTIGFSDQLVRLFSSSRLPLAALRALGFIGLECLPPAKGLLARQTMGHAARGLGV